MTTRRPAATKPEVKPRKPTISAAHRADLALITKKMADLADEHDFCQVFHDAIVELNEELYLPIETPQPDLSETYVYVQLKIPADTFDGVKFRSEKSEWSGRVDVQPVSCDDLDKAIWSRFGVSRHEVEDSYVETDR